MHRSAAAALLVFLFVGASSSRAQDPSPVEIPVIPADPADVASIDGIVTAFYDVISGPVGAPREWGRDETLYLPGITFTPAGIGSDGRPRARTTSKGDWVQEADAFLVGSGFVERELHRETLRFGNIAQVWSTYEWETADGKRGRGINSIHLFHDGDRWWITHATWDSERPDNPIPDPYLPGDESAP
jgi:hypothetical protein